MMKLDDKYKGFAYFLLGGAVFFLAMRMSSGVSTQAAQESSQGLNPLVFILGMMIPFIALISFKSSFNKRNSSPVHESMFKSSDTYSELLEKTQACRKQVLQNNRLYVGSLIVGYGAERFGTWSGHPLFGSPYVIACVYLCAFLACLQTLLKGKKLDEQIIANTIKGVAFESSSKPGYFYGLSKEYRGLGMIMLVFMRLVLPLWVLYSGLEPITKLSSGFSSQWQTQLMLGIALFLVAILLWGIACQPYNRLARKKVEVT